MDTILAAILLAALKFAKKCFPDDDERQCLTQTTAWFLWSTKPEGLEHLPPGHWARLAVRRVRQGRDLPGVKKYNDPMDRCQFQPTVGVTCKRPGPLAELIHAENMETILTEMTPGERRVYDLTMEGITRTDDQARVCKVTPGAISQSKRRLAERIGDLIGREV